MEEKIQKYIDLLLEWNKKINLIGASTIDDIHNRHILDCKQILDYVSENEMNNCCFGDFGSGAGLPGIILSIYGVKNIYLLEKSYRKCEFLNEAKKISDNKISIINGNIFELKHLKFDIIVSRALASLDKLFTMVQPFLKQNTKCIFLKGEKYKIEIEEALKTWNFDYELYDSKTSDSGKVVIVKNIKKII